MKSEILAASNDLSMRSSAFARFSGNPRIGRLRPELLDGLRSWPIYPWTVYYSVREKKSQVEIEAVFHSAMDIDSDDFSE